MQRPRVLFVCGSLNQTTQMHQIAQQLHDCDSAFSTFFADGYLRVAKWLRLTEGSVMGYKLSSRARGYLERNRLQIDEGARNGPYDLVVTCSDQVVQKALKRSPIVLVQEGMTDPEGVCYRLWKLCPVLPRWLVGTSTNGLSDEYTLFCVASEGYRRHFIARGAKPDKVVVTGIPNFDNCRQYLDNDFPISGYVLVCTSDCRETFAYENRRAFIQKAVAIADGRPLVFKLHPNEHARRALSEIGRYAPGACVFTDGNTEHMIANCDVLITRFSSTAYVGLALGKQVYSDFRVDELRRLTPVQTGTAAREIASRCRQVLEKSALERDRRRGTESPAAWSALAGDAPVTTGEMLR